MKVLIEINSNCPECAVHRPTLTDRAEGGHGSALRGYQLLEIDFVRMILSFKNTTSSNDLRT